MPATNKFILGTAQLGLRYGINNSFGKPTTEQGLSILKYAADNGILYLDTAEAYGDAPGIIGEFHSQSKKKFSVITKFYYSQEQLEPERWLGAVLDKLKLQKIYGCLFHSFSEYKNHGNIVEILNSKRRSGQIENVGVSVYGNSELEEVISDDRIQMVQLPYNLLDNYNHRGKLIEKAKGRGKIVHARSVFLQGLFFVDMKNLPPKLLPLIPDLSRIRQLAEEYSLSMESLALGYALNNECIDGVLIGIDNLSQLKKNIDAAGSELPEELIRKIHTIHTKATELLSPVNWN